MKTALLASRQLTTSAHATLIITALAELGTVELHHGAEGAAEQHAHCWAHETGGAIVAHRPDWVKHGRAAGPMRGKDLISAADNVLALWDGKSKGTANELREAKRQGKRVRLILV